MADGEAFNIRATPSFALDGQMLSGVTGWSTLEPKLNEALKP